MCKGNTVKTDYSTTDYTYYLLSLAMSTARFKTSPCTVHTVPHSPQIIIIINDIYRAQTSPRSKCAKSAVAQ